MSVVWQSSLLAPLPWLVHGTTTRAFGSTRYPNSNETEDATRGNRERFLRALGLESSRLVVSGNVHGNRVEFIGAFPAKPDPALPEVLPRRDASKEALNLVSECDGLLTSFPGVVLGTKTADCLPMFFVDPVMQTIAMVHAGWKGVMLGMPIEAVRAFQEHGSRPQDLIVAIGPSIGPCHYTIDDTRRLEMLARTPFVEPGDFSLRSPRSKGGGQRGGWSVDLKSIATRQVIISGIAVDNIDVSAPCTACEQDRFFSYRLSRDASLGMLSVISIQT